VRLAVDRLACGSRFREVSGAPCTRRAHPDGTAARAVVTTRAAVGTRGSRSPRPRGRPVPAARPRRRGRPGTTEAQAAAPGGAPNQLVAVDRPRLRSTRGVLRSQRGRQLNSVVRHSQQLRSSKVMVVRWFVYGLLAGAAGGVVWGLF